MIEIDSNESVHTIITIVGALFQQPPQLPEFGAAGGLGRAVARVTDPVLATSDGPAVDGQGTKGNREISKNRGTPNGWFIMENRIKSDDLGVPLFSETSKCIIFVLEEVLYGCFRK